MHRLPQCHLGSPRVECQNIYQVNQYNTPLSPRVFICKTYIKCSQIWNIQSDNNKTSKGKDSIHHNKDREGRNTIWSNYINKARGTSRSCQIKNMRERDKTHSYWYKPSTPRVNYSLLVMETAEDGLRWWFPPPAGWRNGAPDEIASEQRLAAVKKLI